MPKFSQRYGYTPTERAFQRERIDETLRITLWNYLSHEMWNLWSPPDRYGIWSSDGRRITDIARRVWIHYFKYDLDDLREFQGSFDGPTTYDTFKAYFFEAKWYEAYDFLEFLIQDDDTYFRGNEIKVLNQILEKENAAYRIVGTEFVEITDTNEIKAIEEALQHPEAPVRAHIQSALTMLSDRKNPDYRNSIKESISAVEAACRLVTGLTSATLGEALKKIPNLHPALRNSFLALYGYTSDASGIRHSLLEESNLTYADAKFMLASCSAFVSYLRSNAG